MKYVPLTLLTAFCVKSLVQSVDWPSVAIVGVLMALCLVYEKVSAQDKYKDLEERFKAFKEGADAHSKEFRDIKDSLSALKVAVGMKR